MSERNTRVVRRAFEEVYNQGLLDAVDELVSRDFVAHAGPQVILGPEGMKQYVAALREAFPDLHLTIDDQVAEGDRVATRWTATGTHRGPFHGLPPTGKRGVWSGIGIDRVVGGVVIECWIHADELALLRHLGAIPFPSTLGAGASAGTC